MVVWAEVAAAKKKRQLELRRKSSIEIVFKWILSNSTIIFTIVVLSYS